MLLLVSISRVDASNAFARLDIQESIVKLVRHVSMIAVQTLNVKVTNASASKTHRVSLRCSCFLLFLFMSSMLFYLSFFFLFLSFCNSVGHCLHNTTTTPKLAQSNACNCLNGATCSGTSSNFSCICASGFEGCSVSCDLYSFSRF